MKKSNEYFNQNSKSEEKRQRLAPHLLKYRIRHRYRTAPNLFFSSLSRSILQIQNIKFLVIIVAREPLVVMLRNLFPKLEMKNYCKMKTKKTRHCVNHPKDWLDRFFLIPDLVWSGKCSHFRDGSRYDKVAVNSKQLAILDEISQ